jgi:hypothetical protein
MTWFEGTLACFVEERLPADWEVRVELETYTYFDLIRPHGASQVHALSLNGTLLSIMRSHKAGWQTHWVPQASIDLSDPESLDKLEHFLRTDALTQERGIE